MFTQLCIYFGKSIKKFKGLSIYLSFSLCTWDEMFSKYHRPTLWIQNHCHASPPFPSFTNPTNKAQLMYRVVVFGYWWYFSGISKGIQYRWSMPYPLHLFNCQAGFFFWGGGWGCCENIFTWVKIYTTPRIANLVLTGGKNTNWTAAYSLTILFCFKCYKMRHFFHKKRSVDNFEIAHKTCKILVVWVLGLGLRLESRGCCICCMSRLIQIWIQNWM